MEYKKNLGLTSHLIIPKYPVERKFTLIKLTFAVLLITLNPCQGLDHFLKLLTEKAAEAEARGAEVRRSGRSYNP